MVIKGPLVKSYAPFIAGWIFVSRLSAGRFYRLWRWFEFHPASARLFSAHIDRASCQHRDCDQRSLRSQLPDDLYR